MAIVCPNKNTIQWKLMEKHVGEREAYRAYMAHSYTLPNAISSFDMMKRIGLDATKEYLPEQVKNIKIKLATFNINNGTSHGLDISSVQGKGSQKLKLRFNYLPLNRTFKNKWNEYRTNQAFDRVPDGESYSAIMGFPNTADVGMFIHDEEDAGFDAMMDLEKIKVDTGIPLEGERKGPKFAAYADTLRITLDRLYKDRVTLNKKFEDAKTKAEKIKIARDLNTNRTNIDNVKVNIADIEGYESLEQIEKFAEKDMVTLERIFSVKSPNMGNLGIASRLIEIWKRAGDFDPSKEHIFYDAEELHYRDLTYKDATTKFRDWAYRASLFEEKLIEAQLEIIENRIKDTLGEDTDVNLRKAQADVGILMREMIDVAELGDSHFQALAAWLKDANHAAHKEGTVVFKKIDELLKKIKLKDYDMFRQTISNSDNRHTGEMVHRFTNSFFEWKDRLDRARHSKLEAARRSVSELYRIQQRTKGNRTYFSNLSKGATVMDVNILFHEGNEDLSLRSAPTEKEKEAHIAEMKKLLGERGYEEAYANAEKLVEKYKQLRESKQIQITADYSQIPEMFQDETFYEWERSNSPFMFADVLADKDHEVEYNNHDAYPFEEFVVIVPLKEVKDGFPANFSGFYDEKFAQIEQRPDYMEFYEFTMNLFRDMKAMLPNKRTGFMRDNSVPEMNKEMMKMIFKGNVQQGFAHLGQAMQEYARKGGNTTAPTGEDRREFQLRMLTSHRKRIAEYVENMADIHRAEYGIAATHEQRQEWRSDEIARIADEKSFDLGKIMKAFAQMAISYKHRASIEDQVRISRQIIQRSVEERRDSAGDPISERGNLKKAYYGLENITLMVDHLLDTVFWNYPSTDAEFKGKEKKYNEREKKARKVIQDAKDAAKKLYDNEQLSKIQYDARIDALNAQENRLGGVNIYSNHADALLKYVQLKGMGWNAFAGFTNLGFGTIANLVEGSDGRNYSMKSIRKAYVLALNSVGRNISFNTWNGLNGNGRKIRELMDTFAVLKDSKHEIYKSTLGDNLFKRVGGRLEWANPYNIQSRTEYLNQAPVMIAMMMETKVKTKDGKTINVWEAYNNDGTLKEGVEFSQKEEFALKRRIDKLVKMNHGNYDSNLPIRFKRKFAGRAVLQFRTWALQGFYERFGEEKVDEDLIDRLASTEDNLVRKVTRKGRYRSVMPYFRTSGKIPVIAPVVNTLYQLLRKLAFQKTTFEKQVGGKFTEVDAANMRKNMTELMIALAIAGVGLLLRAFAKSLDGEDETDEDRRIRFASLFMINILSRLSTDIQFYANPREFEALSRYAVPAFSVVSDAYDAFDAAITLMGGGEDILQTGPNKGQSRLWARTKKLLPLAAQYEKAKSAGKMLYKKK